MSVAAPSRVASKARAGRSRRPASIVVLSVLLGILGAGTFVASRAMITNPLEPLGMTTEWLEKSPVDTYLWPGMFFLGMTLAILITLAGLVFPWAWKWARGIESRVRYRWPWLGAVSIGVVLLLFEIIELFLVPFHPIMHPLLIAGSLAIGWLPFTSSARQHLEVS
jgi:MFS family permease